MKLDSHSRDSSVRRTWVVENPPHDVVFPATAVPHCLHECYVLYIRQCILRQTEQFHTATYMALSRSATIHESSPVSIARLNILRSSSTTLRRTFLKNVHVIEELTCLGSSAARPPPIANVLNCLSSGDSSCLYS